MRCLAHSNCLDDKSWSLETSHNPQCRNEPARRVWLAANMPSKQSSAVLRRSHYGHSHPSIEMKDNLPPQKNHTSYDEVCATGRPRVAHCDLVGRPNGTKSKGEAMWPGNRQQQ
jgi:hypothetical protein